ncbi:MAG: hypothetical protein KGL39_47780 [Patescibacteria group bacterium]|nr:hypothetical protein [Patescibacteria group bacterium]
MMILLFFGLVLSALVGAIIGRARRNPLTGALLGLLLGPVGWLVAWVDDRRAQCPECRGRVPDGARRCLHCGYEFARPVTGRGAADTIADYERWKDARGANPPRRQ